MCANREICLVILKLSGRDRVLRFCAAGAIWGECQRPRKPEVPISRDVKGIWELDSGPAFEGFFERLQRLKCLKTGSSRPRDRLKFVCLWLFVCVFFFRSFLTCFPPPQISFLFFLKNKKRGRSKADVCFNWKKDFRFFHKWLISSKAFPEALLIMISLEENKIYLFCY